MKFLKVFYVQFLCLFLVLNCAAQNSIVVNSKSSSEYIGRQVDVYQDASGTLNLEDVRSKPLNFITSTSEVPNLGLTDANNWLRFTLKNEGQDAVPTILNLSNPTIDYVSLYTIHADNSIDSIVVSGSTAIENRNFNHQFYLFEISLAKNEQVTCYLKLKSNKQILAPISIETPTSILSTISNNDILAGIYFGIMFVMLFYNLFIYFSVKDTSYLVYVNYIFWVGITQATLLGFSQRFLWNGNSWMMHHMVTICGALVGIATISFAKSFLRTKIYAAKFNPFLDIVIYGDILAIALIFAGFPILSYHIVDATAGFGAILILIVAYRVSRQNYKPAKFFLIAWTIFLISVIMFVMKDYGLLPYTFLTVHSLQLGSAIEVFLLSIALADRINVLKQEKEKSQAEALEAANVNAKMIREQNILLEAKVKERTLELSVSNSELNKTLQELKDAETHLVESEKMASLGQLTAGIAHEINNPINFVTSNINPLKRDVDQLFEAISMMENICYSEELTSEEKHQQIEDHKEEIDFDYLKLEIAQLLKGINEGAQRTTEIVKGLRIFSRLDEDDLKKANLNEGLDSTIVIINNLLADKITLQKNYADLPMIECYPGKLNQVFLNIITNAIFAVKKRFGEDNGGNIIITSNYNSAKVLISIKDNGTGMDEITRKKIFEPFFTTKDVGEGTGLGMSIAYNVIKKHNGDIVVKSTPGIGTEFIIELPLLVK
ncbi:MAG: 7TM diverse intracellular signaling domain-containing protein [Daejeonella sp.]